LERGAKVTRNTRSIPASGSRYRGCQEHNPLDVERDVHRRGLAPSVDSVSHNGARTRRNFASDAAEFVDVEDNFVKAGFVFSCIVDRNFETSQCMIQRMIQKDVPIS
jgi:hypothetical protein